MWLLVCPATNGLCIANDLFKCAVRRRLGVACCFHGPDSHGHARLADGANSRLSSRHKEMIVAWGQIFQKAGGVPDRNIERRLARANVPVHPHGLRRLDMVAPGLDLHRGLPLFRDVTIVSPLNENRATRWTVVWDLCCAWEEKYSEVGGPSASNLLRNLPVNAPESCMVGFAAAPPSASNIGGGACPESPFNRP
eukprot:6041816-Pyramimonas_sp.AAC.2